MLQEEKAQSAEVLAGFMRLEQEKKIYEMAKNTLESYIINTRSALNEDSVQEVFHLPLPEVIYTSSSIRLEFLT